MLLCEWGIFSPKILVLAGRRFSAGLAGPSMENERTFPQGYVCAPSLPLP
jgi:hypothetical protein